MAKIYVASSWRNQYFPDVVKRLREYGHEVYDFRNPPHDHGAFMWKDVDPDFGKWTVDQYKQGLQHPSSERQFQADLDALNWADTCLLVLPCGRSAHTEAGWMKGAGKRLVVYPLILIIKPQRSQKSPRLSCESGRRGSNSRPQPWQGCELHLDKSLKLSGLWCQLYRLSNARQSSSTKLPILLRRCSKTHKMNGFERFLLILANKTADYFATLTSKELCEASEELPGRFVFIVLFYSLTQRTWRPLAAYLPSPLFFAYP